MVLSIIALFSLASVWLPALRYVGVCSVCCAQIFHIVVIIAVLVARFGPRGSYCANNAYSGDDSKTWSDLYNELTKEETYLVAPIFYEDGLFLKRVSLTMLFMCCVHCCLLSCGAAPQKD